MKLTLHPLTPCEALPEIMTEIRRSQMVVLQFLGEGGMSMPAEQANPDGLDRTFGCRESMAKPDADSSADGGCQARRRLVENPRKVFLSPA